MTDVVAPAQRASRPAPGRRHSVFHPLRVAAVERLTDDAVAVTFDVPGHLRADFAYLPGQHVSVRSPVVGDEVRRNYSICAPATSGVLRIGVKQIPDGVFSGYVATRLAVGDVLDVMTPTGSFTVTPDPAASRRIAAVAAGSGITPVLSILATVLEVEPASSAVLVYVNRTAATVMFLEELEDLKNRHPDRFQLVHVLDEEGLDVDLLSGRLDAERFGRILDGLVPPQDVDDWYLCGPLAMTDAVREVLLGREVGAGHVHRELFHVGPAAAAPVPAGADGAPGAHAGAGASVTVVLDGRRQTFTLDPDGESVLAATLRVRPDAPFACTNGVCGTCRARVLDGSAVMDSNYALEPVDVAAGFVLTCQAHPRSAQLVVDYDA